MDDYETALRIAQNLLRGREPLTSGMIAEAVERATSILTLPDDFDLIALRRDIEARSSVWIGMGDFLEDQAGHVPWFDEKRASIQWRYWHRYERYLEEEKRFAPATVNRLSQLTDEVLRRLEDPERAGVWDRRGLVVGQVQSGKTSNYTGLICKAVDAGYRVVVVLAGRTNSLRSQTQLRLDEGFLGFDTRAGRFLGQTDNRLVGVGAFGLEGLRPISATNSEEAGDFRQGVANQLGIIPGGQEPVLLVVKKHTSVLRNVTNWATSVIGHDDADRERRVVRGVPLLVIDDEADDASINTNPIQDEFGQIDDDQDPTKTNEAIRALLHSFEQAAYVGYTATPFANIFIHPEVKVAGIGPDLFPRHFIVSLPAPSNYIGPARVFGIPDQSVGPELARPALPIVRPIEDYGAWVPDGHKKDLDPGDTPDSLEEALLSFVLSCATRMARGQVRVHNSMLVHVTRFVNVQRLVSEQVQLMLTDLQRRIRYGDGRSPARLLERLRTLWEDEFVPRSEQIREQEPALGAELKALSWRDVEAHLLEAVERIQVRTINGAANDALEYWDHPNGLSVIAIGGDKLSRGLTLEGLTVSYYLRASQMYDTLMQMGRWFGFRDGYVDLCRLYTTPSLQEWYRHITLASEELRLDFQAMADRGLSPEDFGLRVRTHPSGLKITGAGKMREGTPMKVSFQNTAAQSLAMHSAAKTIELNFHLVERFLESLPQPARVAPNHEVLWQGVRGQDVANLMRSLQTHPESPGAYGNRIADYIERQLQHDELTEWTVMLASSGARGARPMMVGGHQVGLLERTASSLDEAKMSFDAILSPRDEAVDLTPAERAKALSATIARWEASSDPRKRASVPDQPAPRDIRTARPATRGMLILYPLEVQFSSVQPPRFDNYAPVGFVVSFPHSDSAQGVEYLVTPIYRQLELGM